MKNSSKSKVKKAINKTILLFNPRPSVNSFFEGVPIALLSISRLLDKEGGYDIRIVSAEQGHDYVKTILDLADGAICLGITSMTGYQIQDGLYVAKEVRKKYPNIPIIWGGWHPSICPEQTIKSPYVDIVIRGQGERTFTELVHRLENCSTLKGVLGITYKQNDRVFSNPDRPIENINNFPPLPYHLVDMGKRVRVSEYGSRTVDYISSTGCPYDCAFCSERKVNKGRWSGLNPQRVVNDLTSLVDKYEVNTIYFHDSNFFVDEGRVREICKGIIKNKLSLKLGQLDARTSQLIHYQKDTWKLMAESGFVSLLVGAESGSQKVLDFIHKSAKVEDTIKMAEICKSYNIGIILSLMMGLPGTKGKYNQSLKEEFEQTISMIDKIIATGVDLNICGWFVYTPYPGTSLQEISIQKGWCPPQTLDGWAKFNLGGKNTPWITNKYVSLLEQFRVYIFPCMGTTYIRAWENRKKETIFQTPPFVLLALLVLKVLKITSSFRWKHKLFSFPIETQLIKLYSDKIREYFS